MSFGQRIQISKFIHDWTPTRHHLAKIDNSVDRRCFACGKLREDLDHVLQCPSEWQSIARANALDDLQCHLSKYFTPAPMTAMIMDSISQWLAGRRLNTQHLIISDDPNADLHALINTAYEHQNFIGWGHFLRGHLSLK